MSIIKNKKVYLILIAYSLLFFIHFLVKPYHGDDTYFSSLSQKISIFEWLKSRYLTWSGRLFPDAMSYLLLCNKVWLWRLVNPLILLLLSYSIVRLFNKEVSVKDIIVVVITIGYIHQGILSSAFFWITGSLNYLWPIAFGIYALIPFTDRIFRNNENIKWSPISLILGSIASISNEQVALCLSSYAIIVNIGLYIKTKKLDYKLLFSTFIFIFGTFFLLLAPGNQIRYNQEVEVWFPGFKEYSCLKILYIGTVWLFDKIFNDMRSIVFLISTIALLTSIINKEITKTVMFKLFTILFVVFVSFIFMGNGGEDLLFNFNRIFNIGISNDLSLLWNIRAQLLLALFPFIFWTIYFLTLLALVFLKSEHKYFVLLSFLAALATMILMFFSPTIYASGRRVLAVSSVLYLTIVYYMLDKTKYLNSTYRILLYSCFPLINISIAIIKWISWGFRPFL